jgi:glycosyltransferase involved in cell wall biosynthesis
LKAVVMFDTQWKSNLKFLLGTAWLRFTSMRRFCGAWVPGSRQHKLASRLGFSSNQIREGVYVAEEGLFLNEEESQPWTEMRILFVNRYVKEKDFPQVLVALNEYMHKHNKPWHITAAGTGPERQHCPANKNMEHVGFVQPKDLPALMQHHDVMVLASRYEPWAVSLHEGALSGMVLLASQHVGAADALIDEGKNGFVFQAGDYTDLTSKLDNLDRWSPEQKRNAKEHSKRKAQALSSLYWYESLLYWLNGCAE